MTNTTRKFEPITLDGIDIDRVGKPRNDGSAGSALYEVPIKLKGVPTGDWIDAFIRHWNNPRSSSTMHRPGIASVHRGCIILNGTTLEEVRDVHSKTLKLAVDAANEETAALWQRTDAERATEKQRDDAHRDHVRNVAKDIRFD